MRLKSVWISEYKNLRDFTLTFDGDSFLDVFVGKNGTGKSNFFEALVEIYHFIFSSVKRRSEIGFDFQIAYEIEGEEVCVRRENGEMTINNRIRATMGSTPIPDNVIIYYSGHGDTIDTTVRRYAKAYARRNKKWKGDEARQFISIGAEYKEMLLSILLMQPADCAARRYICEKLGINVTTETATLTLKPPAFEHPTVEVGDTRSFLWGAQGISLAFVEKLLNCVRGDFTRDSIYDRTRDRYTIPINRRLFAEEFTDGSASELFRSLDNLKTLGMFESLSIPIGLDDGRPIFVRDFSDGQFQSIYIFAISELFKDRNCITLLDEPDSFLHPEWQFEFLKQVVDVAATEAAQTNHVLLSSHSASTVARSQKQEIQMFEIDDGCVSIRSSNKTSIIKSLSAGLISFSETEARMNIAFNLKNTNGPVLFTEGVTDELILETAWKKLRGNAARPFDIQNAFSCGFLRNLLKDVSLYESNPDRKFIGLFDFDEAYKDWVQLGVNLETNPSRCMAKKLNAREGYALLLPVPGNPHIARQVVNPDTGDHYAGRSLLTIELLLHGVPGLDAHFEVDQSRPERFTRFIGDKVRFAKETVPAVPAEHFVAFEPIFESVERIVGTAD